MGLFFSKGNLLANLAQIDGGDVEERGDVLQREHLHHLGAAAEQPTVTPTGGVSVVVEVAGFVLAKVQIILDV